MEAYSIDSSLLSNQASRSLRVRFFKNKLGVLSLIALSMLILLCLFGPHFSQYGEFDQDCFLSLSPPSKAHWLGTDLLGRDLWVRTLTAGRISLFVGLMATLVSIIIGVCYGVFSAYKGGWVDSVLMRLIDIIQALPYIFLVIIFMFFLGRGWVALFLAIGVVAWLNTARMVRSLVLSLKQQAFIQAAKVMGQSPLNIFWKHLLPNILGMVIVCATLMVPSIIMLESLLSFLGIGVPPPTVSLGGLIQNGIGLIEEAPYVLLAPSTLLLLLLLSLNFLGDALKEALDIRF
jgi:oligopeptide transport system permease protein